MADDSAARPTSSTPSRADALSGRRVVIKIGSALLVDGQRGTIKRKWLDALLDDVADLRDAGKEVILVSSGAIAAGRRHLGLPPGPLRLEQKQAAAATGQIRLAHAYQESLLRHRRTVAQILLTLGDTEDRRRYLNAKDTVETLLTLGAVPVINENDTVATEEIRYGDNDRLAARVAAMVSADVLLLLSDIDGLYTADPRRHPEAEFIPEVHALTEALHDMAGDPNPAFGSGGMITKLLAAEIAMGAGVRMIISNGHVLHPVQALLDGARHTLFHPSALPRNARKHWIAGSLKPKGKLTIDAGAVRALAQGGSLLPAGLNALSGVFARGELLLVVDPNGREVGRGLASYPNHEALQLVGHRSREIENILGYRGPDEIIHRDDLVLSRWVLEGETSHG